MSPSGTLALNVFFVLCGLGWNESFGAIGMVEVVCIARAWLEWVLRDLLHCGTIITVLGHGWNESFATLALWYSCCESDGWEWVLRDQLHC